MRWAAFALPLLALAALVAAVRAEVIEDPSVQPLVKCIVENGGSMPSAVVGRACPTCPRGVFATKDLKNGDIIMKIPLALAVPVSEKAKRPSDPEPMVAEYARELLVRRWTDPAFNASACRSIYWSLLPLRDELFATELFSMGHMEMLQHAGLANWVRYRIASVDSVFNGSHNNGQYRPLPEELPGVDAATLRYTVALINTRSLQGVRDGHVQMDHPYLLPLLDMINHATHQNTRRRSPILNGVFHVIAGRDIKKGEEITLNYGAHGVHRPDRSLLFYGFVEDQERPPLAAEDLPQGFDPDSPTDPAYDDPTSPYATREEYTRLVATLAAMPTAEDDDRELLQGTSLTDWRERAILQFRIMRKRALRQAMVTLGETLIAAGHGREGGEEEEDERAEL